MTAKTSKALSLTILFSLMGYQIAFADLNLTPGEVNISVAGIFIEVEGSLGSLEQIDVNANDFTIQMVSGQNLILTSIDRRALTISPTTNATLGCTLTKSSVTLAPTGPITYTITPESSTCVNNDGGGISAGGGGGGSLADFNFGPAPDVIIAPTPTEPAPEPTPEVTPEPTPEPTTEPAPEPVTEPAPEEVIPLEPIVEEIITPPITETIQEAFSEVAQATEEISSGITSIAGTVSEGITQIFQSVTSGETAATGYIAQATENDGSYEWDTTQPLQPESGYPLLSVTEPGDYTLTIISTTDASVQDTVTITFVTEENQPSATTGSIPHFSFFRMLTANAAGPSTLDITYPTGDENLIVGKTYIIRWKSTNLPNTNLVNLKLTKGFIFSESVKAIAKQTTIVINALQKNPVVKSAVINVAAPTSVAVAASSAVIITASASASGAVGIFNITGLLDFLSLARFYFIGLIRVRRKKPWGKVTDKFTGSPIPNCTVQVYDATFNKLKDVQITDNEGAFSAVIGIGKYFLKVSKKGFETQQTGIIEILSADDIINLDITLSPAVETFSIKNLRRISILNALKRILDAINPILLILGTTISIISAILIPSILNMAVIITYAILDILKLYFAFQLLKPFGTVRSGKDNAPVALAVVRIFDEDQHRLLATKVTNAEGRFSFLLAPGKYYATCTKIGFTPFRSPSIVLKKEGMAALDIQLN